VSQREAQLSFFPMLNSGQDGGRAMKFGVIVFPGSNCDHDSYYAVNHAAGQPVTFLWHESSDLQGCDAVVVPGGFAYGDYLRTGAIAKFAPIMETLAKFAASGGSVIGICNGFQILCEAGLLPGALMRNAGLKYVCKQVHLRVESTSTPFTQQLRKGQVLQIPIGHMEGNYYCDRETLAQLQGDDRIVFRYSTANGDITGEANPNGSLDNIAGICNDGRNVLGMMPHPDRSSEAMLGSADGLKIFKSMVGALASK
jgi:phosphoribosylformylglycinamidine synthase subunit PurQ / glutaminase